MGQCWDPVYHEQLHPVTSRSPHSPLKFLNTCNNTFIFKKQTVADTKCYWSQTACCRVDFFFFWLTSGVLKLMFIFIFLFYKGRNNVFTDWKICFFKKETTQSCESIMYGCKTDDFTEEPSTGILLKNSKGLHICLYTKKKQISWNLNSYSVSCILYNRASLRRSPDEGRGGVADY